MNERRRIAVGARPTAAEIQGLTISGRRRRLCVQGTAAVGGRGMLQKGGGRMRVEVRAEIDSPWALGTRPLTRVTAATHHRCRAQLLHPLGAISKAKGHSGSDRGLSRPMLRGVAPTSTAPAKPASHRQSTVSSAGSCMGALEMPRRPHLDALIDATLHEAWRSVA